MEYWESYNANPVNKRVGDCTVRAISTALNESWEDTYIALCLQGFMMCDMPSANVVWGAYLKSRGYKRGIIPDTCPDCYTVEDFCRDNPEGRYILALDSHVIAVISGKFYDTWDSAGEHVNFYWYRKEDE